MDSASRPASPRPVFATRGNARGGLRPARRIVKHRLLRRRRERDRVDGNTGVSTRAESFGDLEHEMVRYAKALKEPVIVERNS